MVIASIVTVKCFVCTSLKFFPPELYLERELDGERIGLEFSIRRKPIVMNLNEFVFEGERSTLTYKTYRSCHC